MKDFYFHPCAATMLIFSFLAEIIPLHQRGFVENDNAKQHLYQSFGPILWTQIFWTQTFWPMFFGPKFFGPEFFRPKIFGPNFFGTEFHSLTVVAFPILPKSNSTCNANSRIAGEAIRYDGGVRSNMSTSYANPCHTDNCSNSNTSNRMPQTIPSQNMDDKRFENNLSAFSSNLTPKSMHIK